MIIPFPPSINRLYRTFRNRVILSKDGRDWFKEHLPFITRQWKGKPLTSRLSVRCFVYPPDRRKRDIDNLMKVTLDICTKAGVWVDDSLIDELYIKRCEVRIDAIIELTVKELK